jgi:hypothetical protein
MKTIEENNRMIAEFMGKEWHKSFFKDVCIINPSNISYQFHISWDWLMPVVDKIESFEGTHGNNYKFTIQNETSYIDCTNIISSPSVKSKIESTYQVVVEFIEWYNEQK